MKFLLGLAIITSLALANDAKKEDNTAVFLKDNQQKSGKRAVYKAAKKACLSENKNLKGNALRVCIVSKSQ